MRFLNRSTGTERITDILERERRAILEGRLDALQRLAEAKAQALSRISPGTSVEDMDTLRQLLLRNRNLLEAASKGILEAKAAIARRQQDNSCLLTYDRSGQRKEV